MRRRAVQFALSIAATLLLAPGCAKPAGVIFPPRLDAPVWPGPPEIPRIRYIGQLATSADLKPAISGGERLRQAFFGKRESYQMLTPYSVCTDNAGRVFIADTNAQTVHVFNLITRKYARWNPPRNVTPFTQPIGICYDPAGRLLVSDAASAQIYIFDAAGRFTGVIGQQQLQRPAGIAFDPLEQRILVVDVATHQLVVLSPSGELLASVGGRGAELGRFNYPTHVCVDPQGRIYVSDTLNFRIQQFSPDLKPIRQIGSQGDMPGYFAQPKGIAADTESHLYVVDANFEAVQLFNYQGQLLMDFGEEGNARGQFWLPAGIHIDARNWIWVADTYNRRVQVFELLPEVAP